MHPTTLIGRSALIALALLVTAGPAWAAKTDIVYLKNGDRLTGEVKTLQKGRLEFSTDSMGTVYIDWEDIRDIFSNKSQSVELSNGQRFYGPISKPGDSEMVEIETVQGNVGLEILDIVDIYPVEAEFWDRLDLKTSLGFTWDKTSNVGKYNLEVDAKYRRPKTLTRARATAELTTQDARDNTTRALVLGNHIVSKGNLRMMNYFGNIEHNEGIGIDVRALVGAAYGWSPIRNYRQWLTLGAGLSVNREIPTDGDQQNNLEGVVVAMYEYYDYQDPERVFDASLMVFPSLTDSGRIRANFDTSFSLEFFSDLFWKLSVYASYDNKPITPDAAQIDYGVTSSLGYKF